MSLSRRGLLGAFIVSPAIIRVADLMPIRPWLQEVPQGLMSNLTLTQELTAITQRAFVPKLLVQIYQSHPVLNFLRNNAS